MQIVEAVTAEHIAQVRELFEEYWASFGFTPCFQNFGVELAGLPGEYRPPGGVWRSRWWRANRPAAWRCGGSTGSDAN